ncbi:hypothetical protein EVAR_19202_1 [Eumeta japonica]|uniref:Reverse transcriptase domain-containing protein n=1 Tax=Eumeta variegata TaxID=151549 RepID=A0A4C1VEN5_EUMVA|nr:hypothetical protein EVAR_19202_1 [Eumeta japonica]
MQFFLWKNIILSQSSGVQERDALGPLMFILTIQNVITQLISSLNLWYLDDDMIGGNPKSVERDVLSLIPRSATMTLHVNTDKYEFFACSNSVRSCLTCFQSILPGFRKLRPDMIDWKRDFNILSSTIFSDAIPKVLESRQLLPSQYFESPVKIPGHVVLTLLCLCFSSSKFTYLILPAPLS